MLFENLFNNFIMPEANIPKKHSGGVYGNKDFYNAYVELYKSLHELINDTDASNGTLTNGIKKMPLTKCKIITSKAKNMEMIMEELLNT